MDTLPKVGADNDGHAFPKQDGATVDQVLAVVHVDVTFADSEYP